MNQKAEARDVAVAPWVAALGRAQMWLAAFAIIAMMLVTVADVLMRYLFNNPVRGTYDFTESMLVVFVFHGIACSFLARSNIVIDLVDQFANTRLRSILSIFGDAFSFVALSVIAYAAWKPAMQALGQDETKLQLGLPIWVLWIVALTGIAGTLVCAGALVVASARRTRPGGARS